MHQHVSRAKNSSRTKLVGLGGFEPPTSPLSGVRSNQLSYRPNFLLVFFALDGVALIIRFGYILTYAP